VYFRPGDFIHRQGELARFFSVIEEGEVEILRTTGKNTEAKVLAVLGRGDFFGEGALLENRPHETRVRARTVVRLRQAGSAVFSQIAGTWGPLRDVLAKAVLRRSDDFWNRVPLIKTLLDAEPLVRYVDPLPAELLRKDTTLADAIHALAENPLGELMVLDETERLWGTLDRHDLYEIIARIAVIPADKRGDVTRRKLSDFLAGSPLCVALEDSALVAFATMLDRPISWLPVVRSKDDPRPIGYIRGERLIDHIIEKIGSSQPQHARAAS
jgi:CRP-like cAMP-binding protein